MVGRILAFSGGRGRALANAADRRYRRAPSGPPQARLFLAAPAFRDADSLTEPGTPLGTTDLPPARVRGLMSSFADAAAPVGPRQASTRASRDAPPRHLMTDLNQGMLRGSSRSSSRSAGSATRRRAASSSPRTSRPRRPAAVGHLADGIPHRGSCRPGVALAGIGLALSGAAPTYPLIAASVAVLRPRRGGVPPRGLPRGEPCVRGAAGDGHEHLRDGREPRDGDRPALDHAARLAFRPCAPRSSSSADARRGGVPRHAAPAAREGEAAAPRPPRRRGDRARPLGAVPPADGGR